MKKELTAQEIAEKKQLEKLYLQLKKIQSDVSIIVEYGGQKDTLAYIAIELDSCISVLDLFLNPLPEEKIK